jgi:integrase
MKGDKAKSDSKDVEKTRTRKKRGTHDGIFTKLPSGSIRVQICIEGHRLGATFSTKKDADDWLTDTKKMFLVDGLPLESKGLTVGEYLDEWLSTHALERGLAEKTKYDYGYNLKKYIISAVGEVKLRDLTPVRLDACFKDLRKAGVGDRTRQLSYTLLNEAFNMAVGKRIMDYNPCNGIYRPIYKAKKRSALDMDGLQRFLTAIAHNRYEALYYLAVATGLRAGELLGLTWSDLDWENRVIRVERQVQYIPGRSLQIKDPKSEAGNRDILLGSDVMMQLYDQRLKVKIAFEKINKSKKRSPESKNAIRQEWVKADLMFPSEEGTPIGLRRVEDEFKRILHKAGLPSDMHPHDLRHTNLSVLANNNIPLSVTMKRAGHEKASTTLNTYVHSNTEDQVEAVRVISKAMTGQVQDVEKIEFTPPDIYNSLDQPANE